MTNITRPAIEEILDSKLVDEYKKSIEKQTDIHNQYLKKLVEHRGNIVGKVFFTEPCHFYKILSVSKELSSDKFTVLYVNNSDISPAIGVEYQFGFETDGWYECTNDEFEKALKEAKNNISNLTGYDL